MSSSRALPGAEVLVALNRAATSARLMSGVIHELNNALQVISGTVELLEGRDDLPPAALPALERLRNQSARAAATLSDVQRFTRAPADETGPVDLHELARHSVNLRLFAIKRAGLSIAIEAGEGDFRVTGNRGQLQQALLNLIVNAEQSLAPARRGSIRVSVQQEEGLVTLRVTDEGPGVPAAQRDTIFDAFVGARAPWEGAGLGLWAAREIATAHGGTLAIEGDAGNTFVLRVPSIRR